MKVFHQLPRCLLLFAAIALVAGEARAQFTAVTGTITDVNGLPYAGGTIKAQLTTPAATVTINNQAQCAGGGFGSAPCQVPIQGTVGPIALNPTGTFALSLADNAQVRPLSSQWIFTVNLAPGLPPPAGTGPQVCTATLTITGASQDISGSFNTCPSLLVIPRIYNTPSAAVLAGTGTIIAATSLYTTPASPASALYFFDAYLTQTVLGVGCIGNTGITINVIFQDPNAAGAQTLAIGLYSITSNGTLGVVPKTTTSGAAGSQNLPILVKGGTTIQYSAVINNSGGCTTAPTIQVFPILASR